MCERVTFMCVLWKGEAEGFNLSSRDYSPVYVERLKDMIEKHTSYEVDFLCLSNLPAEDFREDIRVESLQYNWPAWWSKVEMFNPDLSVEDRVVAMDIDKVILGSLDDIIEFPADVALHDYWSMSSFTDKWQAQKKAIRNKGKKLVPHFSSDVMVFNKGVMAPFYEMMSPAHIDILCGDQDFIGANYEWLDVPIKKFPSFWARKLKGQDHGQSPKFEEGLKTIACHPIKNHQLRARGYHRLADLWEGKDV